MRAWQDASVLLLSCPGPMRRHPAALLPLASLALPQTLLGGESQLLAFAAALPTWAERLYFVPLPEMFAARVGWEAAWQAVGLNPQERRRAVHIRFGSVRDARVVKGIRNAAVIAEAATAPPLNASHHPFASGQVLPAAMRRVFLYRDDAVRPRTPGGEELPAALLPAAFRDADMEGGAGATAPPPRRPANPGLELVSLGEFRSLAWATGQLRPRRGADRAGADCGPTLLVPWNLAHFGSIVPSLLVRLAQLRQPGAPIPRVAVMPFNYLGQTGMIRRLIARLREAAPDPEALLAEMFLARVSSPGGTAALRAITRIAWVDGNDPEHWWTSARLDAAGIQPVLIDPDPTEKPGLRLFAEETVEVGAETRYGPLVFTARIPSLRAFAALLALTEPRTAPRAPARGAPRRGARAPLPAA